MNAMTIIVWAWLSGALIWSGCAFFRIEQRDRADRREAERCGMVNMDPPLAAPRWQRDPSPKRRAS